MLRANSQELEEVFISDPALLQQMEHPAKIMYPRKSRDGQVLTGSLPQKATRLVTILRAKAFL